MVEEKGLVTEEQGGFRRGRGCRDQVLMLMLLGQIKACSRKGMFATFIDFRKAYDRVDRNKLCMVVSEGQWGWWASYCLFTGSLTCEVKVDEVLSDSFAVTRGLRQGCILSPLLY